MWPLFSTQDVPPGVGRKQNGEVGHVASAGASRAEERFSSGRFRVLLKDLKALPGDGCSQRRPLHAHLHGSPASSRLGQ